MNNLLDNQDTTSKAFEQHQLEEQRDNRRYKEELFSQLKRLIVVLFFMGYGFTLLTSTLAKPNIHTTILAATTLTIPTVLILAIMRFLYGNNNHANEKDMPSVAANALKEFVLAVKELFSKSD